MTLYDVRVVERDALELALLQPAGAGEIADPPRLLALLKSYRTVTLRFVSKRGSQKPPVTRTAVNGTGLNG